jgi:hypothetical protein
MNREQEKKLGEKNILDRYLMINGPAGLIVYYERPDFIIIDGDRLIGIEITEYRQPTRRGDRFSRKEAEQGWELLKCEIYKYLEEHVDLRNLSVVLSFKNLAVPRQGEHRTFIKAIHDEISSQPAKAAANYTSIRITPGSPVILHKHLQELAVRRIESYGSWTWNHACGGVGTNDQELVTILRSKFALKRCKYIDELQLVLAGDDPMTSGYIGNLRVDPTIVWPVLTKELVKSPFDVVSILSYERMWQWRRDHGWYLHNIPGSPRQF